MEERSFAQSAAPDVPRSGNPAKIIVASTDSSFVQSLVNGVSRTGISVHAAPSISQLISSIGEHHYDLIMVDAYLTDGDANAALSTLSKANGLPYIAVRHECGDEVDRIVSLELGADICISTGCNIREVIAIIRAAIRRKAKLENMVYNDPQPKHEISHRSRFKFYDFILDYGSRELAHFNAAISITNVEYIILFELLRGSNQVVRRDKLRTKLNIDYSRDDRSIDVFVSRLRRKLGNYDQRAVIGTVRGLGYRMAAEVSYFQVD
jgi:two-component system OmpR family response regulator